MEKARTIPHTTELERHELSAMLPEVVGPAFDDLCVSMHEHGQRETIKLYKGKVLDGWNRWRALKFLGKDATVEDVEGTEKELAEFVYDLNIARRHLSKGQLAGFGADLKAIYAKEASNRKLAGKATDGTKGTSASQAGKAVGVSAAYIQFAEKIKERAPDLYAKVMAKEMTIPQATAELKKREALDTMVDELGNELLDKKMRELFFSASEISDRILKPLAQALKGAKELKECATGVGLGIDIKMLSKSISTARGIVRGGMPHCITPPECNDKECKRRGWMTKDEYSTFSGTPSASEESGDEKAHESNGKATGAKKRSRKNKAKKEKATAAAE